MNVLIYAFREEMEHHDTCLRELDRVLHSGDAFCVPDVVASGFIRLVTNPRVFQQPATVTEAFAFMDALRSNEGHVELPIGQVLWEAFRQFAQLSGGGSIISDAYLAALVAASKGTLITTDKDFGKFPGLEWRDPLDAALAD